MGKLTSAEYRRIQHPDKQALLNDLVRDPDDGSLTIAESVDEILEVLGDSESGMIADVAAAKASLGDSESGIVADVAQVMSEVVPIKATAGAPVTAQTNAVGKTRETETDEITWTAVDAGTKGNKITVDIVIPTELNESLIIDVQDNYVGIVLATELSGEVYVPTEAMTTGAIVTAVNAHETAGLLVQGNATTGETRIADQDSIQLTGAVDITPAAAGAIRFETDKLWISTDESTESVSTWAYASLTDPNAT